jgi:hypothetical protein
MKMLCKKGPRLRRFASDRLALSVASRARVQSGACIVLCSAMLAASPAASQPAAEAPAIAPASAPIFAPSAPLSITPSPDAALRTVPEATDWQATSTSEQVVQLLDAIAAKSPFAHRFSMGATVEQREMPVLVLSNPKVSSPVEAKQLAEKEGRAVVLLFGNIHAGEVDAKEAYLVLARELALGTLPDADSLLRELIVLIAPNYNPDGNDRFGALEVVRPGQVGPARGAGTRHNAMDRDLNRDFGKLETHEARNLVATITSWDPHIIVDGHTANGSWHRYLMTYAGPKVPAGDDRLIRWTRDEFFARLDLSMLAEHAIHTFFYGDFAGQYEETDPSVPDGTPREHTKWTTFPALPRYSTGYLGLRNRIGILSESYSYSSYQDRITGSRALALEILREAARDRETIRKLVREADEDGAGQGETGARPIAIRGEAAKAPSPATLLGYHEERRGGRWTNTGTERTYDVEVWNRYDGTRFVNRPVAYAFTTPVPRVLENLRLHGIALETLAQPRSATVEEYTIVSASPASRAFQGHVLLSAEATAHTKALELPAGTTIVPTNQPLGTLAVYLLEPESEDGLLTWNFFDEWATQGSTFPVVRITAW